MFCKFCGNPIDRKTMKCTLCGKPAGSLSGGNSFRNILQGEEIVVKSDPQLAGIAADIGEIKKTVTQKKMTPLAILSAFCMLLCLLCLVSILALSGKTKRLFDGLNESVDTRFSITAQKLDDIETALITDDLTDEESSSPDPSSFSIDKNPESVTNVTPGITNVAFICRASGEELLFSWIKYSADRNTWETIEDDDNRYEIMSSGNESSLKVINVNNEHEGTYICVIEEKNGDVHYSSPAQLSLAASLFGSYDDSSLEIKEDDSATDNESSDLQDNGLSNLFGNRP